VFVGLFCGHTVALLAGDVLVGCARELSCGSQYVYRALGVYLARSLFGCIQASFVTGRLHLWQFMGVQGTHIHVCTGLLLVRLGLFWERKGLNWQ